MIANILGLATDHIIPVTHPSKAVARPQHYYLDSTVLKNLKIGKETNFKEALRFILNDDYVLPIVTI